jgi:hypothetical protein
MSGCGGGGGGGAPPVTNVTVSGIVTFDFVPAVAGLGLDYDNIQARPVRGANVEIVSGASILASGRTGTDGSYALTVAGSRSAFLRVKAQMQQSGAPSWNFRIADNTNGDALYALDGPVFNTGTANSTRDLHAASGWGGTSYTGTRSAAPFAILDTVYDSGAVLLEADPVLSLTPLTLYWSTQNRPTLPVDGIADTSTGEIGSSFASADLNGIFLLGAENADTDEYDRHVVAHEFGHYVEYTLSRTDSIGGPHALLDRLDLRTAFSEGFSNALSAIVLGDSVYRDATGNRQGMAGAFDIEGPLPSPIPQPTNPGWFSERSIHEIIYDIVDANPDANGSDQLSMDFVTVYAAMRNGHRTATALTSIFTFVDALKAANPAEAGLIDSIVSAQTINSIVDQYGTNETNDGNTVRNDVLPVYAPIAVNGAAVNLCSTDEFRSNATGMSNKLSSRRFVRFNAGSMGTYTFRAVATEVPAGEVADPDMVLHRAGVLAVSDDAPANCSDQMLQNCTETFSNFLNAGDHVLEIYEFSNTQSDDANVPPIGRTCFDVTITQKPASPIQVSYQFADAPLLAQPLEISITISAEARLVDATLALHAGDGVIVNTIPSEIRIPLIEAGDTYRISVSVTPLVLDELFVTVAVEGGVGGVVQAGVAMIPIRLSTAKSRGSATLKPDPIGSVVHSLPGIQSPSGRLR